GPIVAALDRTFLFFGCCWNTTSCAQFSKKSHGSDPPDERTEYRSCLSRGSRAHGRALPLRLRLSRTLLGDCAVARGHGRTPPSSNIFSSHIRSQSGQTRTHLRSAIVRRARV